MATGVAPPDGLDRRRSSASRPPSSLPLNPTRAQVQLHGLPHVQPSDLQTALLPCGDQPQAKQHSLPASQAKHPTVTVTIMSSLMSSLWL